MTLSIETIQKLWIMIGTVIATLGLPWIPEIVNDLFSTAGTEVLFQGVFAVAALWQFVSSRTGKDKEVEGQELKMQSAGATMWYMVNPFKAAA